MSKFYLGSNLADVNIGNPSLPVSKVVLIANSETCFEAGNETGSTIEAECPWATQAMAERVLDKLKGFVYQPFVGEDALLDPAAELGDTVKLDSVFGVMAQMGRSLDRQSAASIGAPGVDEIEDEYPYKSKEQRRVERELSKVYSQIVKTADGIRADVFGEDGLEASLKVTLNDISGQISGLNGKYSNVSQTLEGLTVTTDEGVTLIKGGSVETESLKVSAANISGKLTASQIDATDLKVDVANITGELVIGEQLPDNLATKEDIPSKVSDLSNDKGYTTKTGVVKIIDGTVTADYVNALDIYARNLRGNNVYLLDGSDNVAGKFAITAATTATCAVDLTSYGALRLTASAGDFFVKNGSGQYLQLQSSTNTINIGGGNFIPAAHKRFSCGTAAFSWSDVYIMGNSLNALLEELDKRISALEE